MSTLNTSNNLNQQTLANSGANARLPRLEKGNYIPWETIPNDIYNSVDECANAKEIWERIKRLMHGSDIIATVRHTRLMDEFDKFIAKEGESLHSVYERLTTFVNIIDRNNVCPIPVAINTKFLNFLQLEWSKYVTMVRQNQSNKVISYDMLYDSLVEFEPHVLASRAKKATKNHDLLAPIANSNASSSHSHANSSYSPQSYHVTHPPSVVDYDDEYQGELQGDSQEDKLTTAMILLARAISQKFSSPTNNHLRVSSNTKNQAVCYNCNEKGHYARDCQKPKVHVAKYFREQMLLAMKDVAGSHLSNEENDFMLDNAYGEESLDELTASVMLMARLQSATETTDTVPSYDDKAVIQNPERLKKVIAAQPKMYDGDMLHSEKLIINSTNSEETLEGAEESQNKMKNKMIQVNYDKINALYETFVLQQEIFAEQTYFSIPSTSNHSSESKDVPSESITYAYGDVRAENQDLLMTISELKSKLSTIEKGKNVNTKFDSSDILGKRICVIPFNKQIADKAMNASNSKVNSYMSKPVTSQSTSKPEQGQKHNENVITRGMYKINKQDMKTPGSKASINVSNFTGVESSHSVKRSTSKDIKSKNSILKNINSSSTYVWKTLNSACLDSNKSDTKTSNVIQLVMWIVDSGCSKHMTGNLQLLRNFIEKFMGTVHFGNDHFAAITGYGVYVQGNLIICHVYYVEGLGQNLFLVGQFCDGDLEVAFRSNTCYVRNLEGDDLLTGSHDSNLYTISFELWHH
ncbi:retrovirus-related pol polyprotein from transposon TNT 1-94 [Tanacetum coccineum]